MQQLTESLEDYLEVIAELISVEGHAHVKEIAARLNVKMPSVTGALRQLEKMNYINHKTHYPVQLTEKGRIVAEEVIYRHGILKRFFSEILGLSQDKASETACRLEHVVDSDTICRFVLFSEAIGKRTDARSLQVYLTEAMEHPELKVLSECVPGEKVVVKEFGRNIVRGAKMPFKTGVRMNVEGFSLDRSAIRVTVAGSTVNVPTQLAENIWVRSHKKPKTLS